MSTETLIDKEIWHKDVPNHCSDSKTSVAQTTQVSATTASYQIVHLTPENNTRAARHEFATHVVSLSGGLGSAIAAEWAIERYGREQVGLWFSDVQDEDEDTYRFLSDLMARWGGKLYWYTDGRRPANIWDERKIIPNSLIAPCTYVLKIEPYRKFIQAMPALPVVLIGFKRHETVRQCNCIASYKEAIPEAIVEYPLLWRPEETRALTDICRQDLHIEPPRVYALGYEYNNCLGAGGCCRSGITTWVRTAYYFPERFAARATWEQQARAQGGPRANRSFCARTRHGKKEPLTLEQIRQEYLPNASKLLKLNTERKEETNGH